MSAIHTARGTLSFPQLFTPRPQGGIAGNKLVYSCSILFTPAAQKSAEYKAMQEAVLEAARDKWGASTSTKGLMLPFRDAGEKEYSGYEPGMTYISAWSERKPGIVNGRLEDILEPDEVFAGQEVEAIVNPFAWQNTGKKGVSFGLIHLQITKRNAPRIDGRVEARKAFKPVEDDYDDEEAPF